MEGNNTSRSKKFRILIILAMVATLTVGFYFATGSEVRIEVDGKTDTMVSYAKTVGEFLEKEEIKFKEGAFINVPLDTKLEDNLSIIIINQKPYVVKERGVSSEINSIYDTVGDILNEQGVELGELDYVTPDLKEKVTPDATIEIFRVKEEVVVEESTIPFEKETKDTNNLDKGVTKVVQKGKEGLKHTYVKNKYVNGKLVSSETEKEEVVEKAVNHIVHRGTRVPKREVATASRGGSSRRTSGDASRGSFNARRSVVMEATAYDLSYQSTGKRPGDKYYGITASGMKARRGVVAVDPRVIPLGTRLYVESLDGTKDYGYCIAGDTGGAIKGNRIDLFLDSAAEVWRFGRRKVKVHILK